MGKKYEVLKRVYLAALQEGMDLNFSYTDRQLEWGRVINKDFGELLLPSDDEVFKWSLDQKPWSGYWYPLTDKEVLLSKGSTLDLFDRIIKRNKRTPGVLEYEAKYLEEIAVDRWEGHCHSWAMAASVFKEPVAPVTLKGVELSVNDQKLLMIKSVSKVSFKHYGDLFRGNIDSDGEYQDIRPDHFFNVVVPNLKMKLPVVIDDTAGIETWSKPVSGLSITYKRTSIPGLIEVEAHVETTRHRDEISEALTDENDRALVRYSAYLVVDYSTESQTSPFRVLAGSWSEKSLVNHPDLVWTIEFDGILSSRNEPLSSNMDLLNSVLLRR